VVFGKLVKHGSLVPLNLLPHWLLKALATTSTPVTPAFTTSATLHRGMPECSTPSEL